MEFDTAYLSNLKQLKPEQWHFIEGYLARHHVHLGLELSANPNLAEAREAFVPQLLGTPESFRNFARNTEQYNDKVGKSIATQSWSIMFNCFEAFLRGSDTPSYIKGNRLQLKRSEGWTRSGLSMDYQESNEAFFGSGMTFRTGTRIVTVLGVNLNALYEGLQDKRLFSMPDFSIRAEAFLVDYVNATLAPDEPLSSSTALEVSAMRKLGRLGI